MLVNTLAQESFEGISLNLYSSDPEGSLRPIQQILNEKNTYVKYDS